MKILFKFIICGLLTSLLFPPFFILPIGFIVFPFLFLLLTSKEIKSQKMLFHFNYGLAYGMGLNFIVIIWIKEPFFIYPETHNMFFFSYLLVIYCSVYFGLSFLVIGLFRNDISKLILIPILFVTGEILRENIGYGFPWITFALVASSNIYILNLIYFLGNYGLSFLIIFIFLFPISIILIYKKISSNYILRSYLLASFSIFILSVILIYFRLEFNQRLDDRLIKVSLIQLNLSQNDKIYNNDKKSRFNKIVDIINQNDSEIIIFAENDYPYVISNLKELDIISNNLSNKQSVVIGGVKNENNKYFNTFFLIEKNKIHDFDKIKLVPFGEFLPLRNFLGFLNVIVGNNDFSSGNKLRLIKTSNNLSILPVICYEIIFFNDLLNNDNFNAELLINITNDTWFGNLSGPYQHFYLSRMRAAEYNKTLIRVSNNGLSAIINNRGEIIDYIPLNIRSIKNFNVFIPYSLTNLTTYHSLIIIFLFFMYLIAIVINRKFND